MTARTEQDAYLAAAEARVRAYYDDHAGRYPDYLRKHRYYYDRLQRLVRHMLPEARRVLEIGCGLGQNLAALAPEHGVGIDISRPMIDAARERYPAEECPNLQFKELSALECGALNETFDGIVLVNSLTEVPDPLRMLKEVRRLCRPETRVVQISYNYLWEVALKAGARLGLCQDHPVQNWLSPGDISGIGRLAGFETVREGHELLFPLGIPGVAGLLNRFGTLLPGLRRGAMMYYSVLRPRLETEASRLSVTVCVPCKNEEGNVPALVERIPEMGAGTEIVFVDDRSTDGTAQAVRDAMAARPGRNIKLVEGSGQGKGAACRAGFAEATGDVLMILDADMTVMPEALPEFLEAIASGAGEFINGSRLVYPMETNSMRTLNIFGNKLFAMAFTFLLSQRIKDTLCGTKVIWRRDYPAILAARDRFGAVDVWGDYDWIFGAARNSRHIVELPVHYRERKEGQTKMTKRLRNAMVMLRMVWVAFWKVKVV